MPGLSRNLEQTLHRALSAASERKHEFATLEHLLFALIDDQDAIAVMKACNVDIDKLRARVGAFLDNELSSLIGAGAEETKPTLSFQRAVQRGAVEELEDIHGGLGGEGERGEEGDGEEEVISN